MKNRLVNFVIGVASTLWLVPLYVAYSYFLNFFIQQQSLSHVVPPALEFHPSLQLVLSKAWLLLSLIWLGTTIICWCIWVRERVST